MSRLPSGQTPPALLLVGHGTRNLDGQREFNEVARKVTLALPGTLVVSCCLELAEPTIAQGVQELARLGTRHFVVVPVLLFAGGHARHDIPTAVAQAAFPFPEMTFVQAGHLGCQEPMVALSVRRFQEARRVFATDQGGDEACPPALESTFVALIGRGGTDADAREEMRQFVALRMRSTPAAGLGVGFMAGDGPTLAETLDTAEQSGLRRIVVQPHLLFQGRLVGEVRRQTADRAQRRPDLEWHLAEHLGAAEEVISTLVENYGG